MSSSIMPNASEVTLLETSKQEACHGKTTEDYRTEHQKQSMQSTEKIAFLR